MSKKKKDNDSILNLYNDLITNQYDDEDKLISFNSSSSILDVDDEDGESFITSKEIVKKKLKLERKGPPLPGDSSDIEESVFFKRYSKKREHKYTEKELQEIHDSCLHTIVHDYGENDWYHISDEERAERDQLSEISLKLAGLKKTYRKIDQYIEAMRVVYEAWEILERSNYLHSKDEFFSLVGEGHIVSNRIIMPKMRKLDNYNLDMVVAYISNPELDASRLAPIKKTIDYGNDLYFDEQGWYDQVEANIKELLIVAKMENISVDVVLDNEDFLAYVKCSCEKCGPLPDREIGNSPDDIWKILNEDFKTDEEEEDGPHIVDLTAHEEIKHFDGEYCENILTAVKLIRMNKHKLDVKGRPKTEKERTVRLLSSSDMESVLNPDEIEVIPLKRKYIKGYDKRRFDKKKKKKRKGKRNKRFERRRESVAEILIKIQNGDHYKAHTATFAVTHNLFEPEKSQKSFWDDIRFDGSWSKDHQADMYDVITDQEMMDERQDGQKYLTYRDAHLEKFFKTLEENEISTIELRKNMGMSPESTSKKKSKKEKLDNKKKEMKLLQRISELNKSKEFKKIVEKAEKALNDYKGEDS